MNNFFIRSDKNKLYYIFLALILLCVSVLICWNANWIVGDDLQFITTTAIGRPSHANTFEGRFWPLGLCDYSILLFIPYGHTALAHFIYNAVIMSVAVFLFFNSLVKIIKSAPISLFTTLALIFCSSFFKLHLQCIFAERIIFFMLSIFLFCFLRREKSFLFQFGAWLSATYAIFCKEPMFGLFLIFSILGLLFYRKKSCDGRLYCSIILSSISYVVIYVYRILFRVTVERFYGDSFENPLSLYSRFHVFIHQIENEPILLLLLLIGLIRLYYAIKNRAIEFTDILAFSAWAYIFAYALLGFSAAYYCFPALVFTYPMLASTIKETNQDALENSPMVISCCLICIGGYCSEYFQINLHEIETIFYKRKHDMPFINLLAEKLIAGEEILFLSNATNLPDKTKLQALKTEIFFTEMWNHFLTFAIGQKITQKNGVRLRDSIPNKKCIVISKLKHPNLRCIREECGFKCNIYEYEPGKSKDQIINEAVNDPKAQKNDQQIKI